MTTKPQRMETVEDSTLNVNSVESHMTKNPKYISPRASIKEAANMMESLHTGSLPVGEQEKLSGFITDRDIVLRAIARGLNPETTSVEEVMTNKILYCYTDNELKAVADNMKDNEVLRLVVLDNDKMLKGIITHSQLAKAAVENNDHELCRKVTELACYDKIF